MSIESGLIIEEDDFSEWKVVTIKMSPYKVRQIRESHDALRVAVDTNEAIHTTHNCRLFKFIGEILGESNGST